MIETAAILAAVSISIAGLGASLATAWSVIRSAQNEATAGRDVAKQLGNLTASVGHVGEGLDNITSVLQGHSQELKEHGEDIAALKAKRSTEK